MEKQATHPVNSGDRPGRPAGLKAGHAGPADRRIHSPTDARTIGKVLSHYDIPAIGKVAPLPGGTANRNFLVETARGRYFFRARHFKYSYPEHARLDHALKRHLARRKMPVAEPMATTTGETLVVLDGGYYELYPYLAGEPFHWEREDELSSAACALARCHKALADFPQPNAPPRRKDSPEDILAGLEEVRRLTRDARVLREIDYLAEQAGAIAANLPDKKYFSLPCHMIHGDYHPANVIFRGGNVSGIFDWDCAAWLPKMRDVADGLIFFAARREGRFDATNIVTLLKCCWADERRFDVFLREYVNENSLSGAGLKSLGWFVRARWIFSRVEGRLKVPKKTWPAYLVSGIRPLLEWCDKNF